MMVKHHRVSIFFKVVVSFFASSEHAPPDKSRLLLLRVDKTIASSSSVFHANETERVVAPHDDDVNDDVNDDDTFTTLCVSFKESRVV